MLKYKGTSTQQNNLLMSHDSVISGCVRAITFKICNKSIPAVERISKLYTTYIDDLTFITKFLNDNNMLQRCVFLCNCMIIFVTVIAHFKH